MCLRKEHHGCRARKHRERDGLPAAKLVRQVAAEQTLQHLGSLIESMPEKCRASFVMSQIHGLDANTIAAQLGITDSMVRKYVVRALLQCRAQMDLERND